MKNEIPEDLKAMICVAASVQYPGVIINWDDSDPALVVPLSMRPVVKEIAAFISSYAFKLGVTLSFPNLDTQESPVIYPTR